MSYKGSCSMNSDSNDKAVKKEREQQVAAALQRAETIVESFQNVKVTILFCRYNMNIKNNSSMIHIISKYCLKLRNTTYIS